MIEPYLEDFRKLRIRKLDGTFEIIRMDEFADDLLTKEYYFDTTLPRIPKR